MQKTSLNIQDFAKKIQENENRKKDYIVPTEIITMEPNVVHIPDVGDFNPTEFFHRQVAVNIDIPWKYYQRIMNHSELFSKNVNHWLKSSDQRRMVRTRNGEEKIARAFLSDRYRRIDDEQIMSACLPPLMANAHTQVLSSQITERKLYLMIAFANREAEVKKGDIVRAGIIIMNSEIGLSRFQVLPYVHRLWCDNGAVADIGGKYGFKQLHVGRRVEGDSNMIAYTDETIEADDKALQLKMRDVVTSLSEGKMWDEIVAGMRVAASSEEIKHPVKAIEELGKACNLNEGERESVLTNLLKNGDLTRWGAGNAITAVANQIDDYDRATELQHIGGEVFGMAESNWDKIATAA